MPIGAIVNALAVAIGGLLGACLNGRLSAMFQWKINLIFGVCSVGMGVSATAQMVNMPAVVFALILGGSLGLVLHLGQNISRAAATMQRRFSRRRQTDNAEHTAMFLTVIVLFCASGTGIYGALLSGFSGDQSILLAKSILDLFTAAIFACSIGTAVAMVAIPQCVVYLLLFALAHLIFPLTTPTMIADFKACGGMIMIATGLRIAGVKEFPIADMIPAMALVMPLSWLWTTAILPLVSA